MLDPVGIAMLQQLKVHVKKPKGPEIPMLSTGDRLKQCVDDLTGTTQVFPMSTLKGERKLAVAGGVCLTPLLLHMSQVAVGGVGQRWP